MDVNWIIPVTYVGLLVLTAYYTWITSKILEEQRKTVNEQKKAAELVVAPDVGFQFDLRPKTQIYFVSKANNLYNLTARVFVNGDLKHEQYVGNALIPPDRTSQNTHPLCLEVLRDLERGREFALCIEISYEIRSGSSLVEQYVWKASLDDSGRLLIKGNYPESRKVISAPWIK